jgi:bacillithiol biosynthesis cysteine-adding enzyme BshC
VSSHSDATLSASAIRGTIDLRRFPWIRPLVSAYAEQFSTVASLFAGNPADPAAWRETIARVQRAPRDRAAICAIVDRQLAERGAPANARTAAASLADPATVAVVTGQQAGVFGGPLYTLLKAVTAIQLARRVRADHGAPAVAVFWVDSDDHDWEEVRTASVLNASLEVRPLALRDLPGAGTQPVASLVLDDLVGGLHAALESALPPTEFTADTLTRLRRHYRSGVRLATAFAGWLDELLGNHGLVVFEGADPAARPLVADLWARELDHPCRTTELSGEAGTVMGRMGHRPQVELADDSVALFYVDAAGRRPIKCRDKDFVIGSTVHTRGALQAEAQAHPERFSPNVLLRPIVQDRLFPTVCYVAGPSELAYQAQLGGIYREFGVEAPLLYSRATATLLDSAAVRFLDRHHVPLEALHAQDESALNRLLDSQLPPGIDATLADLDRQMADRTRMLQEAVVAIDPTLAGAVDTTLQKMRDTVKTLHTKIIQASKRKDETLRRQFLRTRALAFPGGTPQERALTLVFFVNRYGPAIGDRLIDILPLDTSKHYVIVL